MIFVVRQNIVGIGAVVSAVTGNMRRNMVRFGRVVSEICKRTDRQTDEQTSRHRRTEEFSFRSSAAAEVQ